MKGMQGCKFFRCDDCGKMKPIRQQNIEKAAYTKFSYKSVDEELMFNVYYIQICNECTQKK